MASTVIDLSDLGTHGFVIRGHRKDEAGVSVACAGDVNGDGYVDLMVGAIFGDQGRQNSGNAYVIYGREGGLGDFDLADLNPTEGFVVFGDHRIAIAGDSLSSAGDINGDGLMDVIVGAPQSGLGPEGAGAAYVIFGKTESPGLVDPTRLGPDDGFVIYNDEKYAKAGNSVSSAGDINHDGFCDIIIGAFAADEGEKSGCGKAYVLFGKASGFSDINLGDLAPTDGFTIIGARAGDVLGYSVSSAGDVNNDGYSDFIIGAIGDDRGKKKYSEGSAYVIFGKSDGFGDIHFRHFTPDQGFKIIGASGTVNTGVSVASAGDFNADGYDDVIVGDSNGSGAGRAFVIYGGENEPGAIDLQYLSSHPSYGFIIERGAIGDFLGGSVSGAGDVNGDGYDDVIIGAREDDDAGKDAGQSYVIFGTAGKVRSVDLSNLKPEDGFVIAGAAAADFAGAAVSAAGDINHDGFADVLVGAPGNVDNGPYAGAAYVIYGMAPTEAVTRIGTDIGQTIHGGLGNDTLEGLGGDDTLIGAEGDDQLYGGQGADQLFGGDGADALHGNQGQDVLTGGAGADQFHFAKGGTAADARIADRITDFSQAEHDVLDLADYDANPATPAIDAFTFIGATAFTGTVGELRYAFNNGDTLVKGDTDGDRAADFTIRLTGTIALNVADFLFAAPAPTHAHAFLMHLDITANPMLHLA